MLVTLVVTYWAFMAISFGTLAALLWTLNWSSTVLIVGFFVLGQAAKMIAEYLVFQKKTELFKQFQTQATKSGVVSNLSDDVKENF